MCKQENPIVAKEANSFETASESLYDLCQELAAMSPMLFAMSVHSYVIDMCKLLYSIDHEGESTTSDACSELMAVPVRSSEIDIRDKYMANSKYVYSHFGIEADASDEDGDECDF